MDIAKDARPLTKAERIRLARLLFGKRPDTQPTK